MKSSEQETLLSLLLLKSPKADELELLFTFQTNLPGYCTYIRSTH